jgi:hypothetical protein
MKLAKVFTVICLCALIMPTGTAQPLATQNAASAAAPPRIPENQSNLAEQFTTLTELTGAAFDDASGQLILIGNQVPGQPTLNFEDFLVALQVVYNGEAPAVSIDPLPGDNLNMQVVFFGGIEGTHFGQVLFESDRLLKLLTMGCDNTTRTPVTSQVPGFQTELQLAQPDTLRNTQPVWHRLWFEPVTQPGSEVRLSANLRAVLFDGAQMTVKTEYIQDKNNPNPSGSDPAAEAFVAHFNQHQAEFTAEWQVLRELANIQRFLIVAHWLRTAGIPIDQTWLSSQRISPADTPATTPRIQVSREFSDYLIYLEGGVDLTSLPVFQYDDALADEVWEAVAAYPGVSGVRQGAFEGPGAGKWLSSQPVQQALDSQLPDSQGNARFFDPADDRLLSFQGRQDGLVVNLDRYDASGLVEQLTVNQPQDTFQMVYEQGELADILPSNPALLTRHNYDFLFAAAGVQPGVYNSSLYWLLKQLFKNKRLAQMSPSLRNRLAAAAFLEAGHSGVYLEQTPDGLVVNRNYDQRVFPELSLRDLQDLAEQATPQITPALQPLLDYLQAGDENPLVLFTGEAEVEIQQIKREAQFQLYRLMQAAAPQRDIKLDDDPLLALRNLQLIQPAVDGQGRWNLALIVDLESFTPPQMPGVEQMRQLAEGAGIPVCNASDPSGCPESNWIFLSGRSGEALFSAPDSPLLSSGSACDIPSGKAQFKLAGKFQQAQAEGETSPVDSRHVIMFLADQENQSDYAHRLVADLAAASGLTYDGQVGLDSMAQLMESYLAAGRSSQSPATAQQIYDQAITQAVEQPDLTPAQMEAIQNLAKYANYISMVLNEQA